jgi:hypothetical protein
MYECLNLDFTLTESSSSIKNHCPIKLASYIDMVKAQLAGLASSRSIAPCALVIESVRSLALPTGRGG